MGNLYEVMPFDNTLVTMDLSGAEILKVLEYGIGNTQLGYVQYSGVKVVYDPSLPAGQRVVEASLLDGRQIDPSTMYKVVTNDFMASGGDQYTMFKQGVNVTDTFIPLRDVFMDAFKKAKVVDFPGDDRLIIKDSAAIKPAA